MTSATDASRTSPANRLFRRAAAVSARRRLACACPEARGIRRHGNRGRLLLQREPAAGSSASGAVDAEVPVPVRRTKRYDAGGTMPAMAGPSAGAAKVQIPRWIQLVGLPILLLLLWVIAGAARHVVFLFLVAALIAFLLNPIVRTLTRVWIPRGFGVALVYLSFFAILLAAIIALGSVVVDQTKSSANRVNDYFTVEHGQPARTHADARRRPLPALARHAPARRDRDPEAGPRPRPPDPQEGRHAATRAT